MLLKRWLTAAVLIPVLLLILLKGAPIAFTLLVLVISILSVSEYFKITSSLSIKPTFKSILSSADSLSAITVKSVAYLLSVSIILAAHKGSLEMMLFLITLNVIAVSLLTVLQFKSGSPILDYISCEIQGVIYIPLFLSFLVLIRNSPNGAHFVVWLWIIVGLSDTGAYFVGSKFGKRPLAKHVSPKKTIEGSLGGLCAAGLVGLIYALIFIDGVSFFMAIIFSVVTAAFSQLGDLFESALKRSTGIKDSGSILPGHGGVLDRIDGIIFAAPVAYLFKVFIL
ncbi:MAG: phosphatidate cytidylyltransferase [Desulfamplus sp.]|nr:phosphatidate cytidylyltransferase [Desulfamplus sp.]